MQAKVCFAALLSASLVGCVEEKRAEGTLGKLRENTADGVYVYDAGALFLSPQNKETWKVSHEFAFRNPSKTEYIQLKTKESSCGCTHCAIEPDRISPGAETQDEFDSQLEYLRRVSMREVGKEAKVKAVKEFIEEHQDDPRVAKAMMHLAGLLENVDPQRGIYAERAAALGWYRKAAARAVPGSETWVKAHFFLESRVVHQRGASSKAEARAILAEIAAKAQGDSLILARVEGRLQTVCFTEHDLDGAERHCRRLLSWYDDPARMPTEPLRKRDLDMLIAGCANGMVQALQIASMPKADRAERIQGLMRDHGFQSLQDAGTEALKELEEMPEFHRRVPLAAETGWTAWLRWTLTLVSVVVFLILGWLFLIRRRRRA